jgi:DNA-binding transcriptional ArsR family regulator
VDDRLESVNRYGGAVSATRRPATEAEIATLSSAVRLRIIRLTLQEPLTNAQIAAALHRDPATTLHHVRRLVRHGFLEALPPRPGPRGSTEIPYRGTRLSWSLSGGEHDPSLAEALLQAYLDEVTEVGVAALEQSRLAVRLAPADAAELRAELSALLDRYAARPEPPDGEGVAVYLSIYPASGARRTGNQTGRTRR